MAKWIKNILGVVAVIFLLWYLSKHWEKLKVLIKLSPTELGMIYIISFLGTLNGAYVVQRLLNALRIKPNFWDMFMLQNASVLLNYAPAKVGTVFQANFLKCHYKLSYAHFATFFMYLTLLTTAAASAIGLVALIGFYGVGGYETRILCAVFLGALVCSIFFAFVPLPIPRGSHKLSEILRNFLTGRHYVVCERRTLFVCAVFLVANFVLASIRFGIIYNSMGQNIHPAGCLILGVVSQVVMFVSITPGALGIRELILGAAAIILGVPLEVGVLAAMIDRAISISWIFVVGGICTILLWHKSPTDFKEMKEKSSMKN